MSKFVKVKFRDRFTQPEGNTLWLNLDNVISVDEDARYVQCVGDKTNFYVIDAESMPYLLDELKRGEK